MSLAALATASAATFSVIALTKISKRRQPDGLVPRRASPRTDTDDLAAPTWILSSPRAVIALAKAPIVGATGTSAQRRGQERAARFMRTSNEVP